MKDVVRFLGSVLGDARLGRHGASWVDRYFASLRARLPEDVYGDALESEWQALEPFAWADFERFLAGWAPGHWKRSGYAADMPAKALPRL